jgi:hypothetical protein
MNDRSTALTNYQKAASLYQQQDNQMDYRSTVAAINELK